MRAFETAEERSNRLCAGTTSSSTIVRNSTQFGVLFTDTFFAEGATQYTDCTGLLTTSGGSYPGSSVFEISANGVNVDKLVIGKPAIAADAPSGGYIDPSTLATCVSQAKSQGWNAGVMSWEVWAYSLISPAHRLTLPVVPGRRRELDHDGSGIGLPALNTIRAT